MYENNMQVAKGLTVGQIAELSGGDRQWVA